MDLGLVLALWIHALGLVIVVGYYGVLGRIIIPSLERSLHGAELIDALVGIDRRALPLVILAVVLFVGTGTYLLLVNPSYQGLGHFTDNTWSTLMLAKHGLIVVFVALGVAVDWFAHELKYAQNETDLHRRVRRLRLSAEAATALGAIAILLTALAQASQ